MIWAFLDRVYVGVVVLWLRLKRSRVNLCYGNVVDEEEESGGCLPRKEIRNSQPASLVIRIVPEIEKAPDWSTKYGGR